jgi:hypothetical protein
VLSGRGHCDELITRPEESYRLLCAVVCELQGVQLKSGQYFNMSNLFTKIYNMLYYTTNLYL